MNRDLPQFTVHKSPITNHQFAGLTLIAALSLDYLPDLGHGFVKDDFTRIRAARIESSADAVGLFTQNVGFYRPVVSATFALNYALSGMNPFAYGMTNFGLLAIGPDSCISSRGGSACRLLPARLHADCECSASTESAWPCCGSAPGRRCWSRVPRSRRRCS